MIENIRKYTGLMIVVLVLLFIGLVFLENSFSGAFSGKASMVIDGEKISVNDFRRLGADPLQIAREMSYVPLSEKAQTLAEKYVGDTIRNNPITSNRGGLLNYMTLAMGNTPDRFLPNRLAVRNAGLEYGVTPGPEEVEQFIEQVVFSDAEGNFDAKSYSEFLNEKLGRLGLDSRAFNEYIRDILTAQNLSNLIGGSLSPNPEATRSTYLSETQSITGQQISLESSKLENEQNPTEEEIKAYWEENQDKYNSDEKRRISYTFVEPDWDAKLKEIEDKKKAEEEERKEKEAAERKKAEEAAKKANEAKEKNKAEKAHTEPKPSEETNEPDPSDKPDTQAEEGAQGETGEQGEPAPPAAEEVIAKTAEKIAEALTPTEEDTPTEDKKPAAPGDAPAEIKPKAPAVTTSPAAKPATPAKPTPPVKEKTAKEKLNSVQKAAAVKAMSTEANDIWQIALDAAEAKNDPIAALKEAGHEIISTELFTKADAPEALKAQVTDRGIGTLADAIFKIPANGALDEKLSNPYSTNEGYFIGVLEEAIESKPLTYEEAKVKATVDLKKKLAREQLKKQAKEVHEKLTAAIKEGKSFADAAKELELTVKPVNNLSKPVTPPQFRGQFTYPTPPAFDAAKGTDPSNLSEVHLTPNEDEPTTALIVFVEKREFKDDESFATGFDNSMKSATDNYRFMAFEAWLQQRYDERDIQLVREK